MKLGLLFLFAISFLSFAAAPDRPVVQAQLLDRNEYLCSNCFFGNSTYYYCFKAGDKVLIGYQKVHTLNWKDSKSNDLTKVRKNWKPYSAQGTTVTLRYDDKNIWLNQDGGKPVKLTQDYTHDIFVNNAQCRAAVTKKTE